MPALSHFLQYLLPLPFRFPSFPAPVLHSPSCHLYHKSCKPTPFSMEILILRGKTYPLPQLPTKSSWMLQLADKTTLFHKSGFTGAQVISAGPVWSFCPAGGGVAGDLLLAVQNTRRLSPACVSLTDNTQLGPCPPSF